MLLTITSTALPWDFYFFKLTQPLTFSTVQSLYTIKEKRGKPDRKSYPLPCGLRNPYRILKSENSHYAQKPQRNCTFMNSASIVTIHCRTSVLPQHSDRQFPLKTKHTHHSGQTKFLFLITVAYHNTSQHSGQPSLPPKSPPPPHHSSSCHTPHHSGQPHPSSTKVMLYTPRGKKQFNTPQQLLSITVTSHLEASYIPATNANHPLHHSGHHNTSRH